MKHLLFPCLAFLLFSACGSKEELPPPAEDGFPYSTDALPAQLAGKWSRVESLRTFDYKPDEWVSEQTAAGATKHLQLNADKTYASNQIDCSDCRIELLRDTLYVKHSKGFYKFPVLELNDTLLHLKTNIDQPEHSLPNTGLFDFILEEKYRRQ
jgi:hypothetical protein